MRVYHRPIERYTHATGWVYIDPDAAPSVITRPAGGGATIETLTGVRYATGLWFITITDALYSSGTDYEMVWTVTIDGDTGDAPPEMFRHVTAVVSGAPTEAVTLSSPRLAAGGTSASFTLTLPTDANRHHVLLLCIPRTTGGAAIESTSSTTAISSGTLTPVTTYYAVAIPVSADGKYGPIAQGSIRSFTTLGTTHAYSKPDETAPDACLVINTRVNDYDSFQADGPHYRDLADVDGSQSIQVGNDIRAVGQGRNFEYRLTCCDPVVFRERGIVFRMRQRDEGPRGTQERSKA